MKTNLTKHKRILLGIMFLMMFVGKAFSQGPNDYNLCIRNMHQTSNSILEFDVFLEWTGTNTNRFQFFQGGLNFNYAGAVNGGVISAAFVAGSGDPSLTAVQQAPNWNLNLTSKQIRFISAIGTPAGISPVIPAPPGIRLGTLRMTNTVPFTGNAPANFAWSYATGSNSTTQTKESFYINGSSLATGFLDVTPFPNHCAFAPFFFNPPVPDAIIGGPYVSCGDLHLNGTVANAAGGTYSSSGTGTFDPDATTLNATYHPSAADLTTGVTITLTTNGGAGPADVDQTNVSFISTDDKDACTTDGCDQTTGLPTHTAVNIDDNDACTNDACDTATGVITHTALTNIDDNDVCTDDVCDSATGISTHTAINTDDNDVCTTDGCVSGNGPLSGPTHTPVNVDDNDVCTTDGCVSGNGPLSGPTHDPINVDDFDACTTDGCVSGNGPLSGPTHTPVNIDDNDACTTDACDPATGVITHTAVNINDNDACTADACDPATGIITHTAGNIDDNDACTTDACDPATGVVTHTAVNINDNDACTADACDPATGIITHTAGNIDDNDACTTDACDPATGVVSHTALATINDGDACTTDACDPATGVVTHTAVNINDNDACTTDACDPATGVITHTAVNINDNDACTTDACDPATGVITHTAVSIDDNDACTVDACDPATGVITHTAVNINDNDACTTDACDPATGVITHTSGSIDDNDACTTDACDPATGIITHTALATINDGDACTTDACDPATGVVTHTAVNIDDNDACTDDACDPATGIITHTAVNINDNDACTTDACDPSTGVITHTAVNIDDNDACTDDACDPLTGIITHTAIAGISDGDACTIDACDPATGVITHTADIPVVTATAGTIACYEGTACVTITASGGLSPYSGIGIFCGYPMGSYNFEVTDEKGCTATSSTVTITEPSKLLVTTTTTPSTGSDGTATANPSDGTPGYSYVWLAGGQTTQTAIGLSAGSYFVTVTDANGCTASASAFVSSSCSLSPPGPISGSTGVCKKSSGIVYCVASVPFATSYVWTLPKGVSVTGASNGACITLKFSTKFKGGFICVKTVSPCGTSSNSCLNVALLKHKPSVPGTISGPASLCPNGIATYSITPVQNASSYLWSEDHLIILSGQGTTTVVVQAEANFKDGKIKVKAVNCKGKSGDKHKNISKSDGCRLSSNAIVTESGILNEALTSLTAYPNPTSGKATVSFNSNRIDNYSLKIIDMIGNVIIRENVSVVKGYNTLEINLENVSKGIYLISVQMEKGNAQTLRLIVE